MIVYKYTMTLEDLAETTGIRIEGLVLVLLVLEKY